MRSAVLVVSTVVLCACSGAGSTGSADQQVTSPVTGLIVGLDGDTMVLEVGGRLTGQQITFEVADPYLPPGHLQEHLDLRLPVRVQFERRGDVLAATVIEDA